MGCNDRFDNRQAYPVSAGLRIARDICPLEAVEQVRKIRFRDISGGIEHIQANDAAALLQRQGNGTFRFRIF